MKEQYYVLKVKVRQEGNILVDEDYIIEVANIDDKEMAINFFKEQITTTNETDIIDRLPAYYAYRVILCQKNKKKEIKPVSVGFTLITDNYYEEHFKEHQKMMKKEGMIQ